MNIQCPTCKLPHALFWRVGAKERDLVYRCNRVEKFRDTDMLDANKKPIIETYYGWGTIMVTDPKLIAEAEATPSLIEEWTHAKRQAEQKKNQHQLVLMKSEKDRP